MNTSTIRSPASPAAITDPVAKSNSFSVENNDIDDDVEEEYVNDDNNDDEKDVNDDDDNEIRNSQKVDDAIESREDVDDPLEALAVVDGVEDDVGVDDDFGAARRKGVDGQVDDPVDGHVDGHVDDHVENDDDQTESSELKNAREMRWKTRAISRYNSLKHASPRFHSREHILQDRAHFKTGEDIAIL